MFDVGRRFYDPSRALWTSQDPKAQFTSLYRYSANPLKEFDPDGAAITAMGSTPEERNRVMEWYASWTKTLNPEQAARVSEIEQSKSVNVNLFLVDNSVRLEDKKTLVEGAVIVDEKASAVSAIVCTGCATKSFEIASHEIAGHGLQVTRYIEQGHSLAETKQYMSMHWLELEKEAFHVQGKNMSELDILKMGYNSDTQ